MARRANDGRAAEKLTRSRAKEAATGTTRADRLVEIIDHCTVAKETADAIGEKFLSYLLSMAIQESRSAMRRPPQPASN